MDKKINIEDTSNPKNGNSAVRDSLVISETSNLKKHKKRSRETSSDSSDDNSSDSLHHRKRSKKLKKKKVKRRKSKKAKKVKCHSDSSDNSDEDKKEKRKKKEKKKPKKKSHEKHNKVNTLKGDDMDINADDSPSFGPAVPDDIQSKSKAMVPMTKEEWEKQQSRIRRVFDEESGRHRLIRGDGEIIEECVSRDRHRQINKQATAADGLFFQMNVTKK